MSSDWLPIGSRWLKAIRSVSIGPSATYESGHFYFAQTGHSHFAATGVNDWCQRLVEISVLPGVGYPQFRGCQARAIPTVFLSNDHFRSVQLKIDPSKVKESHDAFFLSGRNPTAGRNRFDSWDVDVHATATNCAAPAS
jgi:hypothetical protein